MTHSFTNSTPPLPTPPLPSPQYPLAAGEQVTVTFNKPFTTTPRVTLTALTEASASVNYFVERNLTGFTIKFLSAPTATTTYTFDYQIIQ